MDIQKVLEGLDELFAARESHKVEDYLSSNLEQALNEGDVGAAITIINELIGFYRDTSQYDKAEAYCEKLLPFMEREGLKDTIHYGTSCLNIANAYRASGRLQESLMYYDKVSDIYDKLLEDGDFRYASLHNNRSLLYQEMKEYDLACEELEAALSIVQGYPEAIVELAVTYANLATSYNRANRWEQAKEAVKKSLAIFRDGLTGDYHYSAALSVAGDLYFEDNDYENAVSCYEQAMTALYQHVGLTHAYFRIAFNLQTAYKELGKPDALKGLQMAEDYYREYGKSVFDKAGFGKDITFGKIGEGSECFGLDDIMSMDHDFGPGFCIFVTGEQYARFGKQLEELYASLPDTYRGFSRPTGNTGKQRNGVIKIEEFFGRILSLDPEEMEFLLEHHTLPEEVWVRLEDWQLKTVTNGAVFGGTESVFYSIYSNLKNGYPKEVYRRKMAQLLGLICQEGQYNYPRMMQRGDVHGAVLLLHSFLKHVTEFLYLINGVYAPHKKWLMKDAECLKKGEGILQRVKGLQFEKPDLVVYQKRDTVDWIGVTNKEDKVLDEINKIAEDVVALMKEEGLTKSNALYLEQQIPFILSPGKA